MQVLTAPGVMIHEIDKSFYSPAMENTACFIMGFANRGEAYQPQEFTSRTAWLNYYGEPDTEAERYFYAAACEVLNQNGRLWCARLPYDNVSFEKVVAFKYKIEGTTKNGRVISSTTDTFGEIFAVDDSISNLTYIVPTRAPSLFDLSAIDEYRTDEAKVPNNTFLIADVAFNCYNRIQEDKERKDAKRELIGIMPVVTTAANALYAQGLIDVPDIRAYKYETIGAIRTLDAEALLGNPYPKSLELLTSDCSPILNSRDYYEWIDEAAELSTISADLTLPTYLSAMSTADIRMHLYDKLSLSGIEEPNLKEWNGLFLLVAGNESDVTCTVTTSVKKNTKLSITDSRYGWHNPGGDDDLPDTVSMEANTYFPTIAMFTDEDGEMRFERTLLKKLGLIVYKMYMDPTEGNKISFEPVEAYAGSLGKDDKDPDTGVTTFLDTIVNSLSEYVNFFSNCFNTKSTKQYYEETLDMLVVDPPKNQKYDPAIVHLDIIQDIYADAYNFWMKYDVGNSTTITSPSGTLLTVGDDSSDASSDSDTSDSSTTTTTDSSTAATTTTVFNPTTIALLVIALNDIKNKLSTPDLSVTEDYRTNAANLSTLTTILTALGASNTDAKNDATTASLGFYWSMVKEDISIDKSIYDGINKSLEKVSDINERNIDIVCDAGVANIASYLKAIYGNKGEYDLNITDDIGNSLLGMWKCKSNNAAIKTWKAVEMKYDNFCKNVRKDCMFIADGPRPLVLQGQKKIIRSTKPANTIDSCILPYVKFITGLNTSYGAGYLDWFEQADDYSGDFFWCPPSIKAMGVYLNTDSNYMYWDAPAGLNRGVIAATDVAFSPTMAQAGSIYEKNWNYAVNYPQDGIVLEGQKTFQVKPSAFDRVNVRRLFCRLERQAYKVARYFVYEGNTAYTRQRLIDALDPYFKEAKAGGGIYDYKIKCDEGNNTPETIDRNELHCAIGIKPVKTAEFIYIDFVALRTGGSWEEAGF